MAFRNGKRLIWRWTVIIYLTFVHLVAGAFFVEHFGIGLRFLPWPDANAVRDPTVQEAVPTPLPVPSVLVPIEPEAADVAGNAQTQNPESKPPLIIPVAGIRREQLVDTFTAARSEGRVHDAIDIMAPGGTPVVAAADGQIVKFFDSKAGGITIYEMSTDKRIVYYYAHLQRRAENLSEADPVSQGTTIGYVGDTGNAGAGNTHLHFAIAVIDDPKNFWHGTYIDPYPILMGQAGLP
jgi:murein DD-endopeptidase MepM/ murein hydrolase activator NlpD